MRLLKQHAGLGAVLILTAAAIIGLAVLQYRWNRNASEATGVRLADALQLSMVNWHLDLFRNLSEVCLTVRMVGEFSPENDVNAFADRFAEWRAIARYPDLVANVFVVEGTSADAAPRIFQLDSAGGVFAEVDRPAALATLTAGLPGALSTDASAPTIPDRQLTESFYNIGAALRDWRFEPAVPALIRPLDVDSGGSPTAAGQTGARQWLVIQLDEQVLRDRILPDLAHRYFQGTDGLDYEVAVVSGVPTRRVIYSSDPGFGEQEVLDADGRMDLFGRTSGQPSGAPISIFHRTTETRGPTAAVGISWFPLLRETPPADDWQLVVRHRRGGPLGAFVADMERRGLALSFGALFLLVVSLSMLVVASVRAQRLARLQMDFVTAVSHELRTPLTIIGSAADNIANGVIDNPRQLKEYGSVIGEETSRLSGLVERVLLFAATRDGQQRYVMQSLSPAELVDAVLASTEGLVRAAQFTVERDVPPALPLVVGDRMAVGQCLENLVTNAIKYSRGERWIGIGARLVRADNEDAQVQISVSDRGMGIAAADLPHIFEPFYRSPLVRRSQIHGTGLGLALAKQVAESMGATLTVLSERGRGSTFTLSLRCASSAAVAGAFADLGAGLITGSAQRPPAAT
jgi:signal transduction histidine kinase